jgi:putative DNA primase/helicase
VSEDIFGKIITFPPATATDGITFPGRPENAQCIEVKPGELHMLASRGERVLRKANAPFYNRAGRLVRPIVEDVKASDDRTTQVTRLSPVSPDLMLDYLSRAAPWERHSARLKKCVPTDPPLAVARIILARDGEQHFPHLAGVITTPTLRPDGSLLLKAGYDPQTRLLLVSPPELPAIPERPTREDAEEALKFLAAPLSEFPYVDRPSRAVALSSFMTPLARGAIPAAPAHLSVAPAAGSGKSYQNDCVAAIFIGQPCPVIGAGEEPEEMEKQLVSALRSGQALISIDNLSGALKGDLLCQIIERPIVQVRPFGRNNELVSIENRATVLGTGNNLIVSGDMVRRQITCTLDANMERPELRKFRRDPFNEYVANRGKYIAAIFTIIRAYQCAGCPGLVTPLASFEKWSNLIRSPLIWLGESDPVTTMEEVRSKDPEVAELRAVVLTWKESVGLRQPMFARELKEHADKDMLGKFKSALLTIAYDRGEISARKLGTWLMKYRNRIIDGMKIVAHEDKHTKMFVWSIETPNQEK